MSGGFGQTTSATGGRRITRCGARTAGVTWGRCVSSGSTPRADDERLRTCHEIFEAGRPHDDPTGPPMSLAGFRSWSAYGFTGDPRQVWLAADAGGPVGCYLLELPERENVRVGVCLPVVAPAGRGHGRRAAQ